MFDKEIENYSKYLTRERCRPETIKTYISIMKAFTKITGRNPEQINLSDINKYKDYCTKYCNNSMTNKYCSINGYMKYLWKERGILDYETYEKLKIKIPEKEDVIRESLTSEQISKLLEVSKKHSARDYTIFLVSIEGQLRRGDLLRLRIQDVDSDRLKLKIFDAKGGRDAEISITQTCADALVNYRDNVREKPKDKSSEDILFLNNGRKLSKNKLFEIYRTYKFRCGFPEDMQFFPHIMRHSGITIFAENLMKDTKNEAITLKKLMEQSRHKRVDTLLRYLHVKDKEYQESFNKAYDFSKKPEDKKPEENKPKEPETPKPKKPEDNYIAKPLSEREELITMFKQGLLTQAELRECLEKGKDSRPNYFS